MKLGLRQLRLSFALFAVGCSSESAVFDAEEEFIKHLAFSTATGPLEQGALPGGSGSAPRVLAPSDPSEIHTLEPGGSITFRVEWEGGAIEAINWFAGGHYYAVPVNARDEREGLQRVDLRAGLRPGVCAHLDPICHRIRYAEQAVGARGAPGRPFESYLWLDCAGAGCEEMVPEPSDGTENGACTAQATECVAGSSTEYRQCDANGVWSAPRDCGSSQACSDGGCGGSCRPGQTQCSSSNDVQTCDEQGRWGAPRPCENGCANASCQNECTPGQTRCANERDVQTCGASEQYGPLTPCPGGCSGNACQEECSPGATATCEVIESSLGVCGERELECTANGTWPREQCQPEGEELCSESADEDCDGEVNEEPECAPGFVSIFAGPAYACGITTSGGVSCWGAGSYLGEPAQSDGTFANRSTPISVPTVTNVRSVAGGVFGVCAALESGSARCWGGIGNPDGTPTGVVGLANVRAFAQSQNDTCALLEDGRVRCARTNFGPLALFETVDSEGGGNLSGVASIDAESNTFFCARMSDGSASCWSDSGGNPFPGAPLGYPPPVTPPEIPPAISIGGLQDASHVTTGTSHACALVDGNVVCWGSNSSGELGRNPAELANSDLPLEIDLSGARVQAIDAGSSYTCALLSNGRVRCWGLLGQVIQSTPLDIAGITQAVSLSAGQDAACVVLEDRTAMCFGDNRSGQLGNGQFTTGDENGDAEFLPPVRVLGP